MSFILQLAAFYAWCVALGLTMGYLSRRSIERRRAQMEADPFPPLIITVLDGMVHIRVHPIRNRQTWWRRRYVACSVSMTFDGTDVVQWHSAIKDTWSDAVWEARSRLLRMVWIERGMSRREDTA